MKLGPQDLPDVFEIGDVFLYAKCGRKFTKKD